MKRKAEMKTTDVPAHLCPTCGDRNNAASNMEGYTPHAGAVSICINCGEITVFNEDLTQRIPTEEEMVDIKENGSWAQIQIFQIAIRVRGRIHEN